MPRPSKDLTYNTRLRLTAEEHQQVTELQKWYRDAKSPGPLSFNDTVRRAITVAHRAMNQSPVGPARAPAPARGTSPLARAASAMPKTGRRKKPDPDAPVHIEGQTEIEVNDQ